MTKIRRWLATVGLSLTMAGIAGVAVAADAPSPDEKGDMIASAAEPLFAADDGPEPSRAEAELAGHITAWMAPPGEDKGDAKLPPWFLATGLLGFENNPAGGYTMFLASDAPTSTYEDFVAELSGEAREWLATDRVHVSTDRITSSWEFVQSLAWTDRLPTYGLDVDAADGVVVITIDTPTPDEERNLSTADHALRIETTEGLSRSSRTNDSVPHWGGARITKGSVGCSAGFTVKGKTTGTYYSTTAGHCGANGSNWYSTVFYGEMAGKAGYPDYDQARLRDSTYYNRIYTDGGDNFTNRLVTGANDGAVDQKVCQSGATSGSVCNITITSLSSTFCDEAGCSTYLGRGQSPSGITAVRAGDSGGPVYLRNTSEARASIRGMAIAGGGRNIWWERYASMSNHLNVTAVVSP